MKLIHSADIHLGSRIDSRFPREVSEKKREEVRNTFRRMVEYARDEGVTAILLSGDVFDSDKPFKKDKEFFYSVVERNPEIDFLYLRGNHDGEGERRELPNLKTFGEEWSAHTYGNVTVSGIETVAGNATSLYSSLALDPAQVNIVMLHGQIADTAGVDKVHLASLRDKHIDYLALGHVHAYVAGVLDDRGHYAYSGCPEGRGFDETGEKGFVLLEIEGGHVSHVFHPFCERVITRLEVDVTGREDAYAVFSYVRTLLDDPNGIYRVELIGEVDAQIDELEGDVKKFLSEHCLFVDVKDRTRRRVDVDAYLGDLSLAGEFVRRVFANEAYSEEQKAQIVGLGLRALNGNEVEL